MKILMIITGMRSGGAERVMATLCNELLKKHTVRLISLKEAVSDYTLSDAVELVTGKVQNQNVIQSVKAVRNQIDTWKPDVALSFMTKTNIVALLAKKTAKYKVPMIIAERANPYHSARVLKILRKILYPSADGCVFQTIQAQYYYKGILKCESIVLRNPLNPDFAIQPFHGERTKRIVSVGRLSEEKNQKLLIEAFSQIAEKYPDYQVEFYGDGPLKDILQKLIDDKGLSLQIKLMGRKDNIQEHIGNAEIFVLTSDSEGMPNALLEAMALGIACIATDCPIGGPAFIIDNEQNGILLPLNDVEKMSNAIERLITNRPFALELGSEAEKVITDFDTVKVCAEWEKYFNYVRRTKRGN